MRTRLNLRMKTGQKLNGFCQLDLRMETATQMNKSLESNAIADLKDYGDMKCVPLIFM